MTQKLFKSDAQEVLTWIREGTPVFDCDDAKIGKVRHVQLGDGSDAGPVAKPAEFYGLPPEMQIRLARHGFVQIDCGFFAHDRIATPDQIEDLNDSGLKLRVIGDSLITI